MVISLLVIANQKVVSIRNTQGYVDAIFFVIANQKVVSIRNIGA